VAKSTRSDAKGPVLNDQFTDLFAENNNALTAYVAVFVKVRPIINVKDLQKKKFRYDVHRLGRATCVTKLAAQRVL
jgi:hypothetical protein